MPTLVGEGEIGAPLVGFTVIEHFLREIGVPMTECVRDTKSLNSKC